MEAHLAPTLPTQVNNITTLCKICSGPHDTQYCMEDPKQAPSCSNATYSSEQHNYLIPQNGSLSTYSSSYQTKLEKALIDFDAPREKRLSILRTQLEQHQDDMISKINLLWKAISKKLDDTPLCDTVGGLTA
uniref:MAK10-like protein n=1 Tax=Tanacetum cinerariifolium TaxID=118510 RepID=A0A699IMB5_TANCI|nr:hypothetical protein [Tanacetum cinerariifolium]